MVGPEIWGEFAQDPRNPQHAHLRAADADREVAHRALVDAYAEGKLDRDEFEERSEAVTSSKLLGELPDVLNDLLPVSPLLPATVPAKDLRAEAEAFYRDRRRSAALSVVWLSALCWGIWLITGGRHTGDSVLSGWEGFPWPFIVMLVTGSQAVRLIVTRRHVVEERERKLQKRAARDHERALERQRRELEGPA